MACPPDSGAATAEQEAESRNPSGLHRELKKNVTAKPSVKPRLPGPPQRYQPVGSCKVSSQSVNKNVRQAAAAPRTRTVWQEKKPDPAQHSSELPSAGKPDQSKNRQPVQNSKEFAPQVNKAPKHTTAAPCFASQPGGSHRCKSVQNSKEFAPQVNKARKHTNAAPCFATSQPGGSQRCKSVHNSKEFAPQVKKARKYTTSAPCFVTSQPGESQRCQSVQNSKEFPQVNKAPKHTTAAPCFASQPGESQRCKSVQNSKEFAPQVFKARKHTTVAPCFATSQPGESHCKSVQNRRLSSQPVYKSQTRTTAAPHQISLEKPLPPKHPSRQRSNSKHKVHNHQTILCGISAVIHEPRETIRQNCWICKDDLANLPVDEESEPSVLPEVAVMACSHVFHSVCLQLVTPDEQFRDPPCFICMNNLA